MPTIPAAILRQIYRRGSLQNSPAGYSFTMRNHLATAKIVGLRLNVDGAEVPQAQITVDQAEASVPAENITAASPLVFSTGVDTVVRVAGAPLVPGTHALAITADAREIGPVVIQVSDAV